jgi:hypothetical protein
MSARGGPLGDGVSIVVLGELVVVAHYDEYEGDGAVYDAVCAV